MLGTSENPSSSSVQFDGVLLEGFEVYIKTQCGKLIRLEPLVGRFSRLLENQLFVAATRDELVAMVRSSGAIPQIVRSSGESFNTEMKAGAFLVIHNTRRQYGSVRVWDIDIPALVREASDALIEQTGEISDRPLNDAIWKAAATLILLNHALPPTLPLQR